MDELPRHVATEGDTTYSLSIGDAAELYSRAGHPRTIRSIQRYCVSGHLDCIKEATALGDKFFVNPHSVSRHLAQIEELIALENRASRRDLSRHDTAPVARIDGAQSSSFPGSLSRPVATDDPVASGAAPEEPMRKHPTSPETSSPSVVATDPAKSHYVAQIERELERSRSDGEFLRDQIKTKDTQIAALLERDRETNILVGSLQKMLAPLLGGPRQHNREADSSSSTFRD